MCSNVLKLTPWDIDISDFKMAERKVGDDFIYGVIELGRILKEKRDKYKPKGEWTKYLEEIDKSMAGANQFVRLYEYAEKHKKDFYDLNLTNWERINKFLALPEKLRLQLAKEISEQKNISDADFKENLKKVKGEMPKEELNASKKIIDSVKQHSFSSAAEILRKKMYADEKFITKNITKLLEGKLHIAYGESFFNTTNMDKLNKEEKEIMAFFLETEIKNLNKIKRELRA